MESITGIAIENETESKKEITHLISDIEDCGAELESMTRIFELVIERYGLAQGHLTKSQEYDLISQHSYLNDVLFIAQTLMWKTSKTIYEATTKLMAKI